MESQDNIYNKILQNVLDTQDETWGKAETALKREIKRLGYDDESAMYKLIMLIVKPCWLRGYQDGMRDATINIMRDMGLGKAVDSFLKFEKITPENPENN